MKIEAVVFDLGKVLLDFDYAVAARKLVTRNKTDASEMLRLLCQTQLLADYETGRLTTKEFYDSFCLASGFEGSFEEFGANFADIFKPIHPMVELHAKLKQLGIPSYIFSNTNELAVIHIRKTYPFFSAFDGYVLSYEVGCMKPAPRIYEHVERLSRMSGRALLYIDDREENIAAGKKRDWNTILQVDPKDTWAQARQFIPGLA